MEGKLILAINEQTHSNKFNCFLGARRCVRAWGRRATDTASILRSAQAVAADGPIRERTRTTQTPGRALPSQAAWEVFSEEDDTQSQEGVASRGKWPSRQWTARVGVSAGAECPHGCRTEDGRRAGRRCRRPPARTTQHRLRREDHGKQLTEGARGTAWPGRGASALQSRG